MGVQVSLGDPAFNPFGYVPRSGIAGILFLIFWGIFLHFYLAVHLRFVHYTEHMLLLISENQSGMATFKTDLIKLNLHLSHDSAIPFLDIYLREIKTYPHKDL